MKLGAGARMVIEAFRQQEVQAKEAGGVLLGRFIRGTRDLVIDEVTTPMRWDTRSRFFFRRRACSHQRVIDDRWAVSGGTCQYLGEWHTHPEPLPAPSTTDLADWRRRLHEDEFDGDALIFLIVGVSRTLAWEGRRLAKAKIVQLKQEPGTG